MLATGAQAERLAALTVDGRIVTFDSATPNTLRSSGQILGLDGVTLIGLDLRPATRQFYSTSTTGDVYRLDKNASGRDYTAVLVASTGEVNAGLVSGVDFNPVPDRLRYIVRDGSNYRINVDTGLVITDTPVNGVPDLIIGAAAYTNSRPGVTSTMLYGIDIRSDSLVRSTNPNGGVYTTTNLSGQQFGALGFATNGRGLSFDVSGATGDAFVSSANRLFSLDLTTGGATRIGTLVTDVRGLTATAVPEPETWAMMVLGFGLVGAAVRRRAATTATA
jgi:hypothetical protein